MILIRICIIFIFFFSCNTEPIRHEIEVGKTIKIESINFPFNDSYTYLWSKPYGPDNHNSSYTIENNKMLFTPAIAGNFNITLLVESFDKTKLYEENFLYLAIGENKNIVMVNSSPIIKDDNLYGVVIISDILTRINKETGLASFNLINLCK